jgi:hypothetical protein
MYNAYLRAIILRGVCAADGVDVFILTHE